MSSKSVSVEEIKQYLHSLQTAGLRFLPKSQLRNTPQINEKTNSEKRRLDLSTSESLIPDQQQDERNREHHPSGRPERSVESLAKRKNELQKLSECVADCRRCKELADARTQTVFGVGNPNASILFIGEAPGADEDLQGEPFVGRAGKLLNSIIEACHMKREDIYICNILKCRPPGNRNPEPDEAQNCREYLDAQIKIVDPDYIVCWGSVAAKNLLDSTETIGRMRKQFFDYGRAKVLCTYHPSYLLRNPSAKKEVWNDMKLLFAEMGVKL